MLNCMRFVAQDAAVVADVVLLQPGTVDGLVGRLRVHDEGRHVLAPWVGFVVFEPISNETWKMD